MPEPGAAMDISAFKHVVVPVGVVTGLGVGYVVTSIARYMNHRQNLRFCLSLWAWTAITLIMFVGIWWILWHYRTVEADRWAFPSLILLLIGPAFLYMAATLLLPAPIPGETLDLTRRFDDIGRPLFLCMGAAVAWLGVTELVLLDEEFLSVHRAGQAVVVTLLGIGAIFPSRRMARILGGLILILLICTFTTFRAGLE